MLDSFNWSVSRNVALPIRQEDTREGAEPNITEVVVSKRMEKASPKLWQEAVGGAFNTKATIRFTTTAQGKMESFLEYELTDTGLSSYSINSENPDGVPRPGVNKGRGRFRRCPANAPGCRSAATGSGCCPGRDRRWRTPARRLPTR